MQCLVGHHQKIVTVFFAIYLAGNLTSRAVSLVIVQRGFTSFRHITFLANTLFLV